MYKLYIEKNISSQDFLSKILKENYNIDKYELIYNEYGKPFLKDNKLFFNISHDNNLMVIAISDKNIGIDIEYLTYNRFVLKKCFNEKEQHKVNNKVNKEKEFTKCREAVEKFMKLKTPSRSTVKNLIDRIVVYDNGDSKEVIVYFKFKELEYLASNLV